MTTIESLTPAEINAARQLLWVEGRTDEGWEPGSFMKKLLEALQRADWANTAKILGAWPEFFKPHQIITTWGSDELIRRVNAQSR